MHVLIFDTHHYDASPVPSIYVIVTIFVTDMYIHVIQIMSRVEMLQAYLFLRKKALHSG